MTSSEPIFSPVSIATNSKIRMLEVSDGVYLQGDELEEYCLANGLCDKCGKVKVRRKVVKVFGSNKWEPITTVKVEANTSKTRKKQKSYKTVKANINSGQDDDVEYLVYKGYCLRPNCYTLQQAKMLSGTMSHRGFGSGTSSVRSGSSKSLSSNQSNTNSKTSNSGGNKRGKFFSFRKKSSAKSATTPSIDSHESPTPDYKENTMFMTLPQTALPLSPVGEQEDSEHQSVSTSSVLSRMTMDPSADEISNSMTEVSTGYLSEHPVQSSDDNYQTPTKSNPPNTSMSSEDFSVVPSPEVRKTHEHEFHKGSRGSPKKRYYSQDLWEAATRGTEDNTPRSQPIRQIVEETIQALQALPAVPSIRTLDLSGLKLRRSEVEALAKLFKTGKNGTVHLQSLVLNNCGIDDSLMEILSQALYDSLFTANNRIGKNTPGNNSKLSKSMRHARMRLHTLDLGDNDIGDKGISSLCLYLESISCELEQLDLSRNSIETSGATSIFDALKRNPQTKIESIDLSSNLLRELESENSSTEAVPGRSSGIHGFLSKNKTLKELDLSTNRMVDEWVEALCRGLSLNPNSSLEHLSLGYNRIGNRGAVAIGMCLTVNKSLVLLELNDNHIENDGAQALLEAMEDNLTIKDIAGLWSNRIDKRHIIVSIRQLLVSDIRQKRKTANQDGVPNNHNTNDDDYSDDDSESIYITSDSESSATAPETTNTLVAKKSGEDGLPKNPLEDESNSDFLSVQDGGDVSDLSDQEDEDLSEAYERLMQDTGEMKRLEAADDLMETNQEVTHNMFDRMTIMNSSPLVYFDDNKNNARRAISLLDTIQETEAIKNALEAHHPTRGSRIEVKEEMATLDKFKAFFSSRDSSVFHLSCHGIADGIALENGYGSLEKLSLSDLKELVTGCSVKETLELVFVSSPLALKIGKAFFESGVKAVVCCQRTDIFRDSIAATFMECFYQHACQKKTLSESFDAALRAVVSSPLSKNSTLVSNRFHLLSSSSLLSVPSSPIFFQRFIPLGSHLNGGDNIDESLQQRLENRWDEILPPLPDYFLGRELEMFQFLEALQFVDYIEVSGNPGYGKDTFVGSSLEYALKRSETFAINQVCWIPAQKQAMVDPDSLYGDLILCCDLIRDSNIDQWDRSEEVMDCRERLAVELQGAKVVVVIDKQSFTSSGSRSALKKLINFIVTYTASAKVVCISTPTTGTYNDEDSNFSAIKKSSVHIDALSLRSTARLFGEISEHISRSNDSTLSWYSKEFIDLVDIPFIPNKKDSSSENDGSTSRRDKILGRMGNGLPAKVVSTAKNMSQHDFDELMETVLKPEICIDSSGTLQSEIRRWNSFVELAMKEKNYKRAIDLEAKINELEGMKSQFTSLQDLKAKEKSMKSELANAVSNRRYDIANELKRDMLVLKKEIMKERRASTNRSGETPNGVLNDLKFQVDSLADTLEHDESIFSGEENRIFNVECDGHTCAFRIYDSSVSNAIQSPILFESKEQLKAKGNGIVFWCNEACNLEGEPEGKLPLGVDFQKYAANLPIVEETRHGPVRCLMGNSTILDTRSPSITESIDGVNEESVAVLTVGPFATSSGQIDTLLERDDDFRRFSLTTLRSCYRSCMQQTARCNLRSLTICPLTTRTKNGLLYKEALKIAVREILEGAKFSKGLQEVRLIGKTPKEAALLVGIMKNMGFSI